MVTRPHDHSIRHSLDPILKNGLYKLLSDFRHRVRTLAERRTLSRHPASKKSIAAAMRLSLLIL